MAFVRAFGLLQPERTPCGARLPVSEAHTVSVLAEDRATRLAAAVTDLSAGRKVPF